MSPTALSENCPQVWQLRCAARVVRHRGVIAYPTEGVYGLGCDPFDPQAVARLLELKSRSWRKGLIILLADIEQSRAIVDLSDPVVWDRVTGAQLGPTTWLVPAHMTVPAWLTGGSPSLAIRVTQHPLANALCRLTGPLVSTSANPAGARPALSAHDVRRYFRKSVDYVVPGKLGNWPGPTAIRDAVTGAEVRPAVGCHAAVRSLT